MKTLIAYRRTSGLKTFLSVLISLTFMIIWLPFLRAIFDGKSYHWGAEFFGTMIYGSGVTLSFIYLVLQLAFYILLFYSIYHVRNRVIFYGLLGGWFLNIFGNQIVEILVNGDSMFHGDTLNVHISITWIVIPLSVLALVLIHFVIQADRREKETMISWNARNKMLTWIILGPLPLQAFLFATGEPHGITDQIGVIISILQCFLIPVIFRPTAPAELNTAGS